MISIITVTWNAAVHLRYCFDCLSSQTMPYEHIIVDGGSTDDTLSIIEGYAAGRTATKVISEPDNGLYDALNKGIAMATGDVVGILHADDVYQSPDTLAKIAKVFEDPSVEACYGDLLYVSEGHDNSKLSIQNLKFDIVRYWQSGSFSPDKFKWGWMPPHPTFFVRRTVYEKYGLFRLDLGTAADYELMLRFLVNHRIHCAYLPEVLVCMRVGGASNRSLEARLKANRMDRKAWEVNGLRPYPWTIMLKPLRKIPQYFIKP